MSEKLHIRKSDFADLSAIKPLYAAAFPDEDLLPLLQDLMNEPQVTVSLVGVIDSQIAAHIILTRCTVAGSNVAVALLGPLAVEPAWQKQGLGGKLIAAGLQHAADDGANQVCVLGDPAYYGRFGFSPENNVEPPYDLPEEWAGAWQSKKVGRESIACSGKLSVPPPWQKPALWLP